MVSFLAVDSSLKMRCHQQTSLPVCGKRAFGFELLTEKEVHEHRYLTFPKKEPFRKSDEASEEDPRSPLHRHGSRLLRRRDEGKLGLLASAES